ncbi:hypothetical protein AWENTII_012729 [Aspergillus wentii]|nr:D-tyrosyl-tRNA(Tyr) deacylase [Aspergillus wentii]
MKAVIQRVKSASVTVDEQLISSIGRGLLVLAGVGKEDTEKDADSLVTKILKTRFWPTEDGGQWKKNVQDIEGEVLCVSQFTLFGRLKKGNKPDFHEAADVETARRLYDYFFQQLRKAYKEERVKNGVFQAMMDVELKNDGPVTIEINTKLPKKEKKPEESKKPEDDKKEDAGEGQGKQSYEFTMPATLLE